jgi:4-amino-4-deoxychorismate lyase
LWQRHLDRLRDGCGRLGISAPTAGQLEADLDRLLDSVSDSRLQPWIFKVVVTRGSAGRGYRPEPEAAPLRISSLHDWPSGGTASASDTGLTIRTCSTRLGQNPSLAGLKHLCRLEQVMASREWTDPKIDEGLVLDPTDHVIEATSSNLFLQHDDRLITPDLRSCGIAGVVRALILDIAEENNSPVSVEAVLLSDLPQAEALYLCNSIAGIRRVACWDGHRYAANIPFAGVLVAAIEQIHSPC